MASPLLFSDWQIERVKKFGNLLIYMRIPHGFIMDPTYPYSNRNRDPQPTTQLSTIVICLKTWARGRLLAIDEVKLCRGDGDSCDS